MDFSASPNNCRTSYTEYESGISLRFLVYLEYH